MDMCLGVDSWRGVLDLNHGKKSWSGFMERSLGVESYREVLEWIHGQES